jgi:hypothetical protein
LFASDEVASSALRDFAKSARSGFVLSLRAYFGKTLFRDFAEPGSHEIPKRTINRDVCARTGRRIRIVGDHSPSPQKDRYLASCRNPAEDQRDCTA